MLHLILRNLIADKEFLTASANNDLATYGAWQCNYQEGFANLNHQTNEVIQELKEINKCKL